MPPTNPPAPVANILSSAESRPPDGVSANVLWHALVHHSGAWIVLTDETGVVLEISDTVASAFGVPRHECVGRPLDSLLPQEVREERATIAQRALEARRPITVDGHLVGSLRRCTYCPVPASPDGPVNRLLITSRPAPEGGAAPDLVAQTHDRGPLSKLTERELEVLRLIARGYSTTRIAKELHRSVKTVEWHRVSLGAKLGVKNRVELTRIAIRYGLASTTETEQPATMDGAK